MSLTQKVVVPLAVATALTGGTVGAAALAFATVDGTAGQPTGAADQLVIAVAVYCVDRSSRVVHHDHCSSPARSGDFWLWLTPANPAADYPIGTTVPDTGALVDAAWKWTRDDLGIDPRTAPANGTVVLISPDTAASVGLAA